MKKLLALVLTLAVLALAIPAASVHAASPAMPTIGSQVQALTFHLSGQYSTGTKTGVVKLPMPYGVRLLYATCAANAKGGTHGTATGHVKLQVDGTEASHIMDLGVVAAATVVEATLFSTKQNIDKDSVLTADLTLISGSSPTLTDITCTVWVQRRT